MLRICFFGDSFVNGTGDDECLGWPGRVAAAARRAGRDVTFYNLGIRRDTSEDLAGRWREEARRRLPPGCDPRLAFAFGSNDCASDERGSPRVPFARTLANAERILRNAKALAPTLMIGPPPILDDADADARIRLLSDALDLLCRRIGVPFLDTLTFIGDCAAWKEEGKRRPRPATARTPTKPGTPRLPSTSCAGRPVALGWASATTRPKPRTPRSGRATGHAHGNGGLSFPAP